MAYKEHTIIGNEVAGRLLYENAATYATARDAAAANSPYIMDIVGNSIGQYYNGDYFIYRTTIQFDTTKSYLVPGAPIEYAAILLRVSTGNPSQDFDLVVQNGQPTYPHNPVVAGDYDRTHYSGDGGSAAASSFPVDGSFGTLLLNADGRDWISFDVDTKFMIRSSRDIGDIPPTATGERVTYWTNNGTNYDPRLVIRVTLHIPVAVTHAATDIGTDSAKFNGEVTDDGYWFNSYGFEWKEGVGGSITSITVGGSGAGTGVFNHSKTELSSGTTYYYRAWCDNDAGKGYGAWVEFTTESTIPVVTTQSASQISYDCAMGNGTIVSGADITERGFEVKVSVDYFGVGGDIWWGLIGFNDEGDIVYSAGQRTGTLIKRETKTGTFSAGAFAIVLGYADILGAPSAVFNDALMKCESYTYRAYATNDVGTGTGTWVAFDTLCDAGSITTITDDISDGNPVVPIIPIEAIEPIQLVYPKFVWELPEIELSPWFLPDLPDWSFPDYPSMSFVGDFYYRKPYTKKDLDDLRKKCIIYNKNSVEFALVLRHNMNVLREFFNMMTEYLSKDEFNDSTDLIPPQRLKELYLDPLESNDFRDMINEFIRNTVNNNIAVNRNFKLIEEGTADDQTNNEEGTFVEINSNIKTVTEDNPDVHRLKRVIDNLNQEVSLNFGNIMHNLKIVRARLL